MSVIASEAKQSRKYPKNPGLLRRYAPRKDGSKTPNFKVEQVYMLNESQTFQIAGGQSAQSCYEAFKAVAEDKSVGSAFEMFFFTIFLTPLWTIGYVMGQQSAVTVICGSAEAYNQAKTTFCHTEPHHAICKPHK